MACNLNSDQVAGLYSYLYGEVADRMSGKTKKAIDLKALMKELYGALTGPKSPTFDSEEEKKEKALYYIQAIPEVFQIVITRPDVRDYLLKANPNLFLETPTLASQYSDIKKVEVLVKPTRKTRKVAAKEVKDDLDDTERSTEVDESGNLLPNMLSLIFSYAEYSAKVVYPNGTTGQEAVPINPEEEGDKNVKDPEKALFYQVIKDIVYIARQSDETDTDVLYGEDEPVSLALTVVPVSKADPSMFTSKDKTDQKTHGVNGIVAIVTDTDGNEIYFNEDGSINKENKGRRVYQYIRKPYVENGKLFFKNRYNRKSSLVPAEEVAETWAKNQKAMGLRVSAEAIAAKTVEIRQKQTKLFNDLLRFREVIEATNIPVTIKITGGSFGLVNDAKKYVPIEETGLKAEDLNFQNIQGGQFPGRWAAKIVTFRPGVVVDQMLLLQRPNIKDDLARHIADVLTTKLKLSGRELTPTQRRVFFENYLDNKPTEGELNNANGIIVKEGKDATGKAILEVRIGENDPIPQDELYTPETAEVIYQHLLWARTDMNLYKTSKRRYSAVLNYVNALMNNSFTDYVIDEEKGKLTAVEEDYFDFIKDKMLIEFPDETAAYFSGMNAYLNFEIPQTILPAGKDVYELGTQAPKDDTRRPRSSSKEPKAQVKNLTSYAAAKKWYNDGKGTWAMRPAVGLDPVIPFAEHFGNPWSTQKDSLNKNVKIVKDVETAVKNFEDWLTGKKHKNVEQKRRKWILSAISKGWLDNTTFVYYKPAGKSYRSHVDVLVDYINKRNQVTDADIVINEPVVTPKALTGKEKKEQAVEVKSTIGSILNTKKRSYLQRNVKLNSFLDSIFTTKRAKDKALNWWETSFISQVNINGEAPISLTRLTEIANSDAVATFDKSGITLYKGGTNIDIYHEAWHAFSQLFLTPEEQEALYQDVQKVPKWANADYFDIEEDIAEDFRSFMKSEKFKESLPKFLRTIFERIGKFLRWAYGKVTRQDMTRPRDIPRVREMFDVLRTNKPEEAIKKGLFQSLNATTENMSFTKLNRGNRNIQPLKANKNINEFTAEESMQIVNAMDSFMALEFQNYNVQWGTTVGHIRTIQNSRNRIDAYENIKDNFYDTLTFYAGELEDVIQKNLQDPNGDAKLAAEEVRLGNIVDLLARIVENFGDVKLTLDKKQNTGIVAYHMKKSRFNMLKESYNELEDTTVVEAMQLFKDASGNVLSSKQVASEETMMLLSGIFQVKKDKSGNVIRNEEGGIEYEKDFFGLPKLENVDLIWNRLAKLLEGSYDITEMHQRILDSIENYPELEQLMNLLPQLANTEIEGGGYKTGVEFKTETNFWQDLKKPRIKYIQLNINKEGDGKYDATLAKASMDVYAVRSDWESNFILADTSSNKYIEKEPGTDNNILKVNPKTGQLVIVEKFSKRAIMTAKDSIEFLKAVGIELDLTSPAINNIVFNKSLNFSIEFGIDKMLEILKVVNQSNNIPLKEEVLRNPLKAFGEGLPVGLRKNKEDGMDVRTRIRVLAELQNAFSDGYSNFSVLNAERNRVWEHFVDNTITRTITSLNKANTYQELTKSEYFKHMHWLAKENNTMVQFSQLVNSIFHMKFNPKKPEQYGTKRKNAKLLLQNVTGTQFISKNIDDTVGSNTSSMDGVSKFLQEYHTMLLNGVEEFMRHASKNVAMGLTVDSNTSIITYPGKSDKKLYVDIDAFEPQGIGEMEGAKIMMGYLSGEANRIFRFRSDDKFKNYAGYNREVVDKLGRTVMAGEAFTLFDDMLSKDTQRKLYAVIDEAIKTEQADFNLADFLEDNIDIRTEVEQDLIKYFNALTQENLERLGENSYVDANLLSAYYKKGVVDSLEDLTEMLTKAYSYNSTIHKFETIILAYGDAAQYNHAKEEFHKRNAGLGSGGRGFRADELSMLYVNTKIPKEYIDYLNKTRKEEDLIQFRKYDGTFNTAIMKEVKLTSVYYDEYLKELTQIYTERYGDAAKAKTLAEKVLKEYKNMKIADGQGYVTLEAYRILKNLEGNWSDTQELLYKKVSNGENISIEDSIQYFPPYKVQYFGNIQSTGLPVNSFHKFSLAPIIPGVAKEGTELYDLHIKMLEQQVDYVTFETGSKVAHIGKGDQVYNEDGTFNKSVKFTKNVIFAEFLKNQTEINASYKGVSIFSTQLRKMILEGLYEQGEIKSKNNKELVKKRAEEYIRRVEFLTNIHKLQLLDEIGYEEVDGQFIPTSSASTEKIANLIRTNLEKDDILSDDLIDFIDVFEKDNTLVNDLSFHPESGKIEKLLLSIINKKVIKQKVKGEALVQVSSAFYNNYASVPAPLSAKTQKERDDIIKKFVGTNFLPTYHRKANGFTAAMKVMISMQGDYMKLFNLEYENNESVGVYLEDGNLDMDKSLERLNEKIKDDKWLDANNEANRKAITMMGVRIPVQGLNSMEFMEVYHFLPPQAGNIIIPPAEIVAKSGGDFDIDKLTIFMTNLNEDGKIKKADYSTYKDFKKQYELMKSTGMSAGEIDMFFEQQKAGIENELIDSMKEILELPDNYSSLITPNGTYILKDIADDLAQYVMKYNPYQNKMTEPNINTDGTKAISPTRILESLYNVYKHESNIVGKRTLGLGAIENTFNVIFNTLGAYMPNEFFHGKEITPRQAHLWLRHHKMNVDGEEHISISNMFDVDNENKIADVLSQMINGWVDVEKDPWIFFIQGNYETAPTLLYLLKTGVPVNEAIYFVSNPLVVEYIKEKTLSKSTFAEVLNKKPKYKSKIAQEAAGRVIKKYFFPNELSSNSKIEQRYQKGVELANEFFEDRKDKNFTEDEMYNLIKNFKINNGKLTQDEGDLAKTMFLHYLEIEQQITGLTALKLSSNPDTSTKTTVSEVELSEAGIDELANETKIPKKLLQRMLNDSVISSFFNGPMSLAIIRPLFKLRYNKQISDFIIQNSQTFRNKSDKLLGERKIDTFMTMFRNDIINMIFQNAVRKYKMKDSYMSYTVKKEIPTALATDIKSRGAFVKANKDGSKVLYIDEASLREEFESEAYVRGSEEDNSYENRNMYPLDPRTFMENGELNFDMYLRFVAEREFLRSEFPITDMVNKSWFRKEGLDLFEANPGIDGGTLGRFVYERYITNKALDNSYNFYHLFQDKNNSLGSRYSNFLVEHKDSLLNNYELLNVLKLDTDTNKTVFNLYVADKDMNTDKANVYTMNLKNLSNRAVMKVTDKDENDRISDMFALMSNFAFLQTGFNKTKLNFTNIVDFTNFLDVMKEESEVFAKALQTKGDTILREFFEQFLEVNSRRNINKGRYKNYLMDLDFSDPDSIESRGEDELDLDVDIEETDYSLEETDRVNVFTFKDTLGDKDFYKQLVKNNSDTVFIRNNVNDTYTNPKKKFGGQQVLDQFAKNMTMNITTSLTKLGDNMQTLPKAAYKDVMTLWEEEIAHIKSINDGQSKITKIAFPTTGFGDPALMPQELFVYLSKRLFDEFGFVNPGSTMFNEMQTRNVIAEGITDEEILNQLGLEEDPFKCE